MRRAATSVMPYHVATRCVIIPPCIHATPHVCDAACQGVKTLRAQRDAAALPTEERALQNIAD